MHDKIFAVLDSSDLFIVQYGNQISTFKKFLQASSPLFKVNLLAELYLVG